MREVFILLPAAVPTGPVKGAYALANALAAQRRVMIVTLRAGPGANAPLDAGVRSCTLATHAGVQRKIVAYAEMLRESGGRERCLSISMCFSADIVNLFCGRHAVTCSSVRGNLFRNYRMDYGLAGVPLAAAHLASLRGMDHVVAMTDAMRHQVRRFAGRRVQVIGNFVDEPALEAHRSHAPSAGALRFAFLGSLSRRKQPLAAVAAIDELRRRRIDATLDVIGTGPLEELLQQEVARAGLVGQVRLHGFRPNPYDLLAGADALVLPSLSEGLSRACLEALHLGVPCVLRAADGNDELIRPGVNGSLFVSDEALPDAMLEAAQLSRRSRGRRQSLLPPACRQRPAALAYLALAEPDSR